jgi:hypothetical protein
VRLAGVRDDLRDYVVDAFGNPEAILVVDLCRACDYAEPSVMGW